MGEEELISRACKNLQSRNVTSMQMCHDGGMEYREASRSVWKSHIGKGGSLAECKGELVAHCGVEEPMHELARRASEELCYRSLSIEEDELCEERSGSSSMAACLAAYSVGCLVVVVSRRKRRCLQVAAEVLSQ